MGGRAFYMRGGARRYVEADANLVAVALRAEARFERRGDDPGADGLESVGREVGLELVATPVLSERERLGVFRARDPEGARRAVAALGSHRSVKRAGAVVALRDGSVSFLSDELVVKVASGTAEPIARRALRGLNLRVVRPLRYLPDAYLVKVACPPDHGVLEVAERVARDDLVEWAEPNLCTIAEPDGITPTDYLWPALWDRTLVGLPEAWQALQDAGVPAYGSPEVVIAIVDTGIYTVGGAPAHSDFQGSLSDGSPKVHELYDFNSMAPDNDFTSTEHGVACASIATALADNPVPGTGKVAGVVGAAPNCRLMSVVAEWPWTDVGVADAFVWTAGLDAGNPDPAFPAKLAQGADIISASLPLSKNDALPAVGKAMLDFVTTYGRGGRGCLCFFSAGNESNDVENGRPYAAYGRSFGIAATSIADDGTTEERAAYSGWGNVALCAPSDDGFGSHEPPEGYAIWSATSPKSGLIPSHVEVESALSVPAQDGDESIVVADAAPFVGRKRVLLGAPGSAVCRPLMVGPVDVGTGTISVAAGDVKAAPVGTPVVSGPMDHINDFSGTSAATPMAAGIAALVLSAAPDLSWVQARQILRDTALKLQPDNTDPVGQWLDAGGNPSVTSGEPPLFSKWFGYGRVRADLAVKEALAHASAPAHDLVVRDSLADLGEVPSPGPFWDSPDIWVRRMEPAADGAEALPAGYAEAGPHEPPQAGKLNHVYVRVRNAGAEPSIDAWVRVYVSHFPGLEFVYPNDFIPDVSPGDPLPSPLEHGTYLIGEKPLPATDPGAEQVLTFPWPPALVPPDEVDVNGQPVKWHPCLLAEIVPHDGAASGAHVWERSDLAQKNVTIAYVTSGGSDAQFSALLVVGNDGNPEAAETLEARPADLPDGLELMLEVVGGPRTGRRGRHALKIGSTSLAAVVVRCVLRGTVPPGEYSLPLLQRGRRGEAQGSAEVRVVVREPA